MWSEEDEEEDDAEMIIPGSERADKLINIFSELETGNSYYFSEAELEFLFYHFFGRGDFNEKKLNHILDIGLNIYPNSGIFQLMQAQLYIHSGNFEDAIEILKVAKVMDPTSPEIDLMLSDCYYELKQLNNALNVLLEHEINNPEFNMDVSLQAINLLTELERDNEALNKLKKIISSQKDKEDLAFVLSFHFEYDITAKAVEIAIDDEPFSYELWQILGFTAYYHDVEDKSIEAFEYAHLLNEESPIPLFYLGQNFKNIFEFSKAREYFQQALESGYRKEDCIIEIAHCMNRSGESAQARVLLQNTLGDVIEEETPVSSVILYEIAYSYYLNNEINKAEAFFLKSDNIAPNLSSKIFLGEFALMRDDLDTIVEYYHSSKELIHTDSLAFYCGFFSLFYRYEDIEHIDDILDYESLDFSMHEVEEPSLLNNIFTALKYKLLGQNIKYVQEMLKCFSEDSKETLKILELIDKELLLDPDIINIKELF